MKRFRFSLETVKTYKDRLLSQLKNEYGLRLADVHAKEAEIEKLKQEKDKTQQEFNEKNAQGLSILESRQYQYYLDSLHKKIKLEQRKLKELVRLAEEKKEEIIEVNKETTSLAKLKDKKMVEYNKMEAKEQELFIEEFVSRNIFH